MTTPVAEPFISASTMTPVVGEWALRFDGGINYLTLPGRPVTIMASWRGLGTSSLIIRRAGKNIANTKVAGGGGVVTVKYGALQGDHVQLVLEKQATEADLNFTGTLELIGI